MHLVNPYSVVEFTVLIDKLFFENCHDIKVLDSYAISVKNSSLFILNCS